MSKQNGKWLVDGSVVLAKLSALVQDEINDVANKIDASEKGVANGVATLDGSGKVPVAQLPNAIMEYQGTWNASTNSPSLSNTGNADEAIGNIYRVSAAGSVDFGAGAISFEVGDYAILNSSKVWEKADMSDGVVSVNGQSGVVVLDADDIDDASTTNKFATQAQLDKVDFISITQAVDLDALETASHSHTNKAILDATTASFLESHEDKLDLITVTQAVDLDDIQSDISGKADTNLGNLSSVSINADLLPDDSTNERSVGSSTKMWNNVYTRNISDNVNAIQLDISAPGITIGTPGNILLDADSVNVNADFTVTGDSVTFELTSPVTFNNAVQIKGISDPTDGQDVATKSYVDSAISNISDPTWVVQEFVLAAGDISNKYVTLSNAPIAASVLVYPDGAPLQRVTADYTITGSQLDFVVGGDLEEQLEAGDVLIVKYQY